jgi:formate dehydrogenase subunit gamma
MPAYEWWSPERASEIISQHSGTDGPLLPVLQALQKTFGCVPEAAVAMVAEALNLSRAEVHGVFTFYHDFRREPAARRVLKLCRAEACQAAGGDGLAERAQARLGVAMGTTAPDGGVTLEPVYCLGLCATAPSAMVDGRVVGRLDEARLDAVLAPSSPTPRLREEGRGEGAFPQTRTEPPSSDSWRGPLTRNLREERANSDLSIRAFTPVFDGLWQAGRGKGRAADFGQPTAAVTRWRVSALPSDPLPVPGIGRARWRLELTRCRGGESAEFEVEACDAQGRLALPSDLVHGSGQKAIGRRRTAR